MTRQETINEAYDKTLELYQTFIEYRFDEDSKVTEYSLQNKIFEILKLMGSIKK